MSPDSSDPSQVGRRSRRRRFVPGVYNYCDAWCERCPFQQHCRLFHDQARYQAALKSGHSGLDRFLFDDDPDDEPEDGELTPETAIQRAEFLATLDAMDADQPSEEELERLDLIQQAREQLQEAHPLSVHSADYVEVVRGIVGPLRELLDPAGHPLATAALDAIDRHAYRIAAKLRRAVAGLVGEWLDEEPEDDLSDLQSDANGCAKLARLLMAESRESWTLLRHSRPAAAEGVPESMIQRLDALDQDVRECFPNAMAFVRPGFDDHTVIDPPAPS